MSRHTAPFLRYSLVGVLILTAFWASSVRKSKQELSEEIKQFHLTVLKRLENYKNDENTKFLARFGDFWLKTEISADRRKDIVEISDMINAKNLAPDPFLTTYLSNAMQLCDSTSKLKGYDAWTKGVKIILAKKGVSPDIYLNILNSPANIISSKCLFVNDYIRWTADSLSNTYQYDTTLYLKLPKSKITSYCQRDTVHIYFTSGKYYPLWNTIKGHGGTMYWKASGYDSTKVFANLKSYALLLKQTSQNFDSVTFSYHGLLKHSIIGSLIMSYNDTKNPEQTYYPQFTSYKKDLSLVNLFDSINFVGGLSLKGHLFLGYGTHTEPASITIIKGKKPFIIAKSKSFQILNDGLNSQDASILIRMVRDSISHNNKIFSFNGQSRELRLMSDSKDIVTKAPYLDSYHRIGILSEQLYWKFDTDNILFNTQVGSNQSDAYFESYNFFNQDMFDDLMRRDEQHPVYLIRKYERDQAKNTPLTCDGFARFIRKSNFETENLLKEMAFLGYIVYNKDSRVFKTTSKLRDAIRARNGQLDYDPILFISESKSNKINANLDLSNFNLSIYGIPQINLSDSQNVKVYPHNNTVILKHNRDMEFDGEIRAGLTTFRGNGFKFNYDTFSIDIDKVVSMNFDYKTDKIDNTGNQMLSSITSTIENITGTLNIDQPNNKSGLKPNPSFPKFKSKKDSYIYYDDPSIFGGIYSRDKFYFRLYPYEIDSLNSFEKDNLQFKGEMVSADIFAPFEHTIKVQPDQSLGFTRKIEDEGVTVYKGKGRFFNTLHLSNKGLIGSGSLKYVNSTSYAKQFYYFPDSCISYINNLMLDRVIAGVEFPNGNSGAHPMKWLPYKNVMDFFKDESPFNMYDNQVSMVGSLKLEPIGLTGNGGLSVNTAKIRSHHFDFRSFDFSGNNSSTTIYNDSLSKIQFASDSVLSRIDLKNYKGHFTNNNLPFKGFYPELCFMSYAPEVQWDMNNQTLALAQEPEVNLPEKISSSIKLAYEGKTPKGAVFISTRKDQDSLCFASPLSVYEVRKKKMTSLNVKQMLLGDAILLLNSNRDTVIVRPNAALDRIYKADLIANRDTKLLHFYDTDMMVGGRNGFNGIGSYTYTDKYGKEDTVRFGTITLDREYKTIAYATISEDNHFFLSPFFKFKGKVTAQSEHKNLLFDGGAQLTHKYKTLQKNWLRFTAEIAPDSVMIPISYPYQTIDKITVFAGTYHRRDSINVYPSFFTGRKYTQDSAMVTPQGFLFYNDQGNLYQVSSKDKIQKRNTAGDMLALYNDMDILVNEGKLAMGVDLGEASLKTGGRAIHNINTNELKFSGLMAFDFLFNNESMNILAADILASSNTPIDYKKPDVMIGLREFLGDKQSLDILTQYEKGPILEKLPEEYKHTFVFNDMQLRWERKSKSFISVGDIGVVNIGDKQINRKVKGFIELSPNNDHRLYIYLNFGSDQYAMFIYTSAGNMFAASSNELFNIPVDKTRGKRRSIKRGLWETTYIYNRADERIINTVKARYNQIMILNKDIK